MEAFTVVLLYDNRLHVDDEDVSAFFHPQVTPINQVLKTFVTVVLLLRNEIFDSCQRTKIACLKCPSLSGSLGPNVRKLVNVHVTVTL